MNKVLYSGTTTSDDALMNESFCLLTCENLRLTDAGLNDSLSMLHLYIGPSIVFPISMEGMATNPFHAFGFSMEGTATNPFHKCGSGHKFISDIVRLLFLHRL